MDKFPSSIIVTPVDPQASLDTFVNALVAACPFDDPNYRRECYVGIITEAKVTQRGMMAVYFKTPDLVGGKWIGLDRIKGMASYAWEATA